MASQVLISELQQILLSDFGIKTDIKTSTNIGDSLIKYFELLTNMNNNEKPKIPIQK